MSRARALARALTVVVVLCCAWPIAAFSMRHYLPEVDNDELMYFLLVKTFRSQGFQNGYSFTNDRIPAGPIHFNIQGPGVVPLYAMLSRVVGWTNQSPYLANLLLFVPSWLLLSYAMRRHPYRQIAVSLFVLANGYFFIFLPSVMQESFHLSVAIAMAALWLIAVERESIGAWAALFVLTAAAMLVRYSWAIVLPCFVFSFVMQRARTWSGGVRAATAASAALAVGGVATVAAVKLLVGWALPASASDGSLMPQIAEGFNRARLSDNLGALVHLKTIGVFADYPKYFLVSVIGTLAAFLAIVVAGVGGARGRAAAVWGFVILAGALGAQTVFYGIDGWRDFRVLLPMHAVTGLMFLSTVDIGVGESVAARAAVAAAAALLVVVHLWWLVPGLKRSYPNNWSGGMTAIDEAGRQNFAELAPHLATRSDAPPFCKTVYANKELWSDARLAYMPDVFSVSAVLEEPPGQVPPLRGKYVLLKRNPAMRASGATRSVLSSLGIDPRNHEAIIAAELSGRIRQGRASGWADDDPDNPVPVAPPVDLRSPFERSGQWRKVAEVKDLTLFRSTVNCL